MQILSLSHRLMNPRIDNYNIFSAPAVLDYEAIVVDVGGVAETVRTAVDASAAYQSYANLPIVNGESVDGVAGIAETLSRRAEEIRLALERGATVIVFMDRGGQIAGVSGNQGLERYFFLPAPGGLAWNSTTIRGGEGRTLSISEPDHPTIDVIESYRRDILYRAYFNDRAPGFAGNARVIARSAGGAPIAAEFKVFGGRVIFLPTPREPGARWLIQNESKAILTAFDELLGRSDDPDPSWIAAMAVPGGDVLAAEQRRREAAAEEAERELTAARTANEQHHLVRDALWRTGQHGLLPAVAACAAHLGFEMKTNAAGEPILVDGERELHLVVAGSEEAVGMAAHYRLRSRLDSIIERGLPAARGLIVANGQRLTRPEERLRQVAPPLATAAESVGYAVVRASELFEAACLVLDGLDDQVRAAIRGRLRSTDGVVGLSDLLAPPDDAEQESA